MRLAGFPSTPRFDNRCADLERGLHRQYRQQLEFFRCRHARRPQRSHCRGQRLRCRPELDCHRRRLGQRAPGLPLHQPRRGVCPDRPDHPPDQHDLHRHPAYRRHVRAYYLGWESANSNEQPATVTSSTPTWDANSSWSGSGSTESWSHTVAAGSNRILIVTTAALNSQATAVTFNTAPLTLIGTRIDGDDASRLSMWYLVNPAVGAGTVQVTFDGSGNEKVMGASSWTGVHQTTPIGSFVSNSGSGTTPSVTVSSTAGEVVVDAVSNIDAGTLTVDPSQTQHWKLTNGDVTGGHSSEPGDTSVTMSWTMPSDYWAIGAVALKPA